MQEFNLELFSDFIKTTLFENMSVEDYVLVIEKLFDIRPTKITSSFVTYHSFCHHEYERQGGENLSLKIESMMFTCYSHCGSMDLLKLVKTRYDLIGEDKTSYKCMQEICQICSIPFDFAETEQRVIEYDWKKDIGRYRKGKKSIDNSEIKVYDDKVLNYFPKVYHSDWIGYGISEQTLDKFEIRYYPYRQQIVIPCYNHLGQLVGCRVRNMNDKLIEDGCPRYMPLIFLNGDKMNFPTNSILFGEYQNETEIRKQKTLYLAESEKSVLKLDTLMNGKGIGLGMMGSAISDENIRYILSLGVNIIRLCPDNDFREFGDEDYKLFEMKTIKLAERFLPFCKVEVIFNNVGIKNMYKASPFDFTMEQFKEMYRSRIKLN